MSRSYVEDLQNQLDLDKEQNHYIERYEDVKLSIKRRCRRPQSEPLIVM